MCYSTHFFVVAHRKSWRRQDCAAGVEESKSTLRRFESPGAARAGYAEVRREKRDGGVFGLTGGVFEQLLLGRQLESDLVARACARSERKRDEQSTEYEL